MTLGVDVFFVGTYTFWVNGLLNGNGTANNLITFRGDGGAGSWKSLYFTNTAKRGCKLDYCTIKDGGYEYEANIYIDSNDSNVEVTNCDITNSLKHGVCIKAYSNINCPYNNNTILKCMPLIANNVIHHNKENGIKVISHFQDCKSGGNNNKCIASPLVKNNLLYNNSSNAIECYAFGVGGWVNYHSNHVVIQSNPIIQQNTIYGSSKDGIFCHACTEAWFDNSIIETNPFITSNIITNCNNYGLRANNFVSISNVKHNNYWNNIFGNFNGIDERLGKNIRTNINHDSCDVNSNIAY